MFSFVRRGSHLPLPLGVHLSQFAVYGLREMMIYIAVLLGRFTCISGKKARWTGIK